MRPLKVCLWIVGVACLLGVVGLFLPMPVLSDWANAFGEEKFPDSPVFEYTVRGLCAICAMVGVFFIVLARHPTRYAELIPFCGGAGIFVGFACLISGPLAGVPAFWYVGDFLFCTVFGLLILMFSRGPLREHRRIVAHEIEETK